MRRKFAKERQAADELLARITDAQKALEVHSDVHRAMCVTADAGPTGTLSPKARIERLSRSDRQAANIGGCRGRDRSTRDYAATGEACKAPLENKIRTCPLRTASCLA